MISISLHPTQDGDPTYRPVELAVAMFFKECRPNQHIRHRNSICNFFCIRLPRSHCAERASSAANSMRSHARRVFGPNRIKDVDQVWHGAFDLFHNIFRSVIHDVGGPKLLYEIKVLGTAHRGHLNARQSGELDCVLSNACFASEKRESATIVARFGTPGTYSFLPR